MGCSYSTPLSPPQQTAAAHSYTSLDTPNSTSIHKQLPLDSRNSNLAAEALVYIQQSAFFHGLSAGEKAKLAFLCERTTLTSEPQCLVLGDLNVHCGLGETMLTGGVRSLTGELSLIAKSSSATAVVAPVGASAPPTPPIPNPTIANLIFSSTPNSHSPSSHSSLFLRQGSGSSLNRRKLFAMDVDVVQDGTLDITFRSTASIFKMDCAHMRQALEYKTVELLTARAKYRDPKFLAKHTLLGSLFMDYPKDLSAICQLFEFRTLVDAYQKRSSAMMVVLIIEGFVDAYVNTVLVGSFGPGSLLHESRLFRKENEEEGTIRFVVRDQRGLALCLDAGQLQTEILPKLPPVLRTRFEDEALVRDTQAFKQCFAPWFTYMSDASVAKVVELTRSVVLQDGEQMERVDDLVLVKSGEVTVSHSLTRKSSSGTFIWAREDDLAKHSGELVLAKPVMDSLFEAKPCSTISNNGSANSSSLGVVVEDDDDVFEIRASCNDTRVLCIPTALIKSTLAHESGFAADFELRVLKDQAKFDNLLIHPISQHYFREYLQSVQAIENLDFWLAAKAFAQQEEKEDLMLSSAETLFSEYVASNSDKQVNLPGSMRQSLEHSIVNKLITRDLFQGAALECFSLMHGCIIRFHKSDLSARMFQAIATGMSLEDCRSPPPLPAITTQQQRESSPHRRSTVRRLTSSDGNNSSGLLRIRRHSSSQTTAAPSPRPSFNKDDVNAVTIRRTSALLTTPRSSPMKSPLSGFADVKLDDE